MQAGSSFQPPFYQNVYHAPAPGHQDHDLKRRYLALLPPQQIIEICLAFDHHVPYYVKSSIWPLDINAAIAGMQKTSPKEDAQTTETLATKNPVPPMGSLVEPSESSSGPLQQEKPPQEPQPPDEAPIAGSSPPDAEAPANLPPPQQSAYQPYAYPPMQAAYPHSPYYPHHPAYTQYQYSAYSHLHHGYTPQHQGYTPQHAGYPQPPTNPPYNATTAVTSPPNQESVSDDLPSYEEMIVEALTDAADPDGCAPKELFTWMASHYPLQSNFRPSASQALQKAFKRGRFEKSNGGKYRLNSSWEGGNTSRRTTRRPQTQNQPTPTQNPLPVSPFTHAPLVHHHNQPAATTPQPYQAPPYGYPYTHMPGYSGYTPQPPQPQPAPTAPTAPEKPFVVDADVTDAYEAAQNILKAINFSNLLPLPSENENKANGEVQSTSTQLPVAQQGSWLSAPITASDATTPDANPRAELQAQLALLAAQLAELAREGDVQPSELQLDASTHFQPSNRASIPQPSSYISESATPSTPPLLTESAPAPVTQEEEESDSDDMDDMEEVI